MTEDQHLIDTICNQSSQVKTITKRTTYRAIEPCFRPPPPFHEENFNASFSELGRSLRCMVEKTVQNVASLKEELIDTDEGDDYARETAKKHQIIQKMAQAQQEKCHDDLTEFRKLRQSLIQTGCITTMSVRQTFLQQAADNSTSRLQNSSLQREMNARSA